MKDLKFYRKEGDNYIALNEVKPKLLLTLPFLMGGYGLIAKGFLNHDNLFGLFGFILLLLAILIFLFLKKSVIINPREKTIAISYPGLFNRGFAVKCFTFSQIIELYTQEKYEGYHKSKKNYVKLKLKKENGNVKTIRIFTGVKDRDEVDHMLKETQWLVNQDKK